MKLSGGLHRPILLLQRDKKSPRGFGSFQVYVVKGNFSVARHLLQVPPDGRLVGGDILVGALVTGVLLALTISTISAVLPVML